MFDLTGRVALVTGAGRGVGRGVAGALARQGAAVVVNDLEEEGADETVGTLRSQGGSAFASPFDVVRL